jgi:hypothetical protein
VPLSILLHFQPEERLSQQIFACFRQKIFQNPILSACLVFYHLQFEFLCPCQILDGFLSQGSLLSAQLTVLGQIYFIILCVHPIRNRGKAPQQFPVYQFGQSFCDQRFLCEFLQGKLFDLVQRKLLHSLLASPGL